jgi:type IV pilus assembly protein PilE
MKRAAGFTLMELMIVLVIISILATIAYPMYTSQLENNSRLAAQGEMMSLAATLETYRAQNLSYGGADLAILGAEPLANEDYDVIFLDTANGDAPVNVLPVGTQAWGIRMTPKAGGKMENKGAIQLDSQGRTFWDEGDDGGCDVTDPDLAWGKKH